jgi:hypothetical protein
VCVYVVLLCLRGDGLPSSGRNVGVRSIHSPSLHSKIAGSSQHIFEVRHLPLIQGMHICLHCQILYGELSRIVCENLLLYGNNRNLQTSKLMCCLRHLIDSNQNQNSRVDDNNNWNCQNVSASCTAYSSCGQVLLMSVGGSCNKANWFCFESTNKNVSKI